MNPITDYLIVTRSDPHELSFRVNQLMTEGWTLYGFPFASAEKTLHQTMIKREPTQEPEIGLL
jgi:hypothetical protein